MDAATMTMLRAAALQRRVRAQVRACISEEIAALQAMLGAMDADIPNADVLGLSSSDRPALHSPSHGGIAHDA